MDSLEYRETKPFNIEKLIGVSVLFGAILLASVNLTNELYYNYGVFGYEGDSSSHLFSVIIRLSYFIINLSFGIAYVSLALYLKKHHKLSVIFVVSSAIAATGLLIFATNNLVSAFRIQETSFQQIEPLIPQVILDWTPPILSGCMLIFCLGTLLQINPPKGIKVFLIFELIVNLSWFINTVYRIFVPEGWEDLWPIFQWIYPVNTILMCMGGVVLFNYMQNSQLKNKYSLV